MYSRLETVKVAASELSKSASERKMANPAAIDLGLQDPDGKRLFLVVLTISIRGVLSIEY